MSDPRSMSDADLLAAIGQATEPRRATNPRVFGAPDPFKVRDQQIQEQAAALAARSADRQDANSAASLSLQAQRLQFDQDQADEARRLKLLGAPLTAKDRGALEADYKTLDFLFCYQDRCH